MKSRPSREEILAELKRRGEPIDKGFAGIGEDVNQSLENLPNAAKKLVASIPGGINNVGHYATTRNPVSTLANLGAGGVESGAALLSSPEVLKRYLSGKFPGLGNVMERGKTPGVAPNDSTLFESLMNFEKNHGLAAQDEEEASVRNAGGLLFGGGVLKQLPNMLARSGTLAAEQAGRGGDPLHAAILGLLGEGAGKLPYRKAKDLPAALIDMAKAVPEKVKQIPQLKANIGQAIGEPMNAAFKGVPQKMAKATDHAAIQALESAAETAAKYHVPVLPRKLLTKAADLKYKTDPVEAAKQNLFQDIESEDLAHMTDRHAAFKLLGLDYGTIGELLGSPFESSKQGNIGRTPAGKKLLLKKGKGRMESEEASINKTLDDIYNENTLSPEKNAAYKNTMNARVPEEFIQKWSSDPVVKKAMKELEHEPAYEKSLGKNPDKTSFNYWDHIKKIIGDMEAGTEKVKGTKKFKKSVYTGTRKDMVSEMDLIHPPYAGARRISEREHIRNDIERHFNKREKTGNNFHKFLSDKQKFDALMVRLEGLPQAQAKLKAWKLIGKDLIPEHMSNRAATALEKTSMTRARNEVDAIQRELAKVHGQKHDVAEVKLLTDPNLMYLISEHLNNKKGTE